MPGPIRLVAMAMGSGVALGVAAVSAAMLGYTMVRADVPSPTAGVGTTLYLLFGFLVGPIVSGLLVWRLLDTILSIYRRGGLSVVSGLATVVPMQLCIPVNQLAGPRGLAALSLLAASGSLLLGRLARRSEAV